MAMFHCTDKKIALKDNLADYINKRTGLMMNPVFYLYLKLYKAGQLLGTDRLIYSVIIFYPTIHVMSSYHRR